MRLRKRTTRLLTAASAVALLAAASHTTASGTEGGGEKTLAARPLATWQTDGIVWSVAYAHGVVYVGGTFGSVRPPGARPGQQTVARRNFAAFDAVSGKLLPCTHTFSGGENTIRALKASRDGKVLYVGGSFDRVDGEGTASAVALDTADCALRRDFRPAVSATVRAIEPTDTAVYLGGDFTHINGRTRNHIASLTPSGSLLPFKADIDDTVRAILAVPKQKKVIVGGSFEHVDGVKERSLVALDSSTGSTVTSYPHWIPMKSAVKTLAQDGTNFYVGAEGAGIGVFDGRIAGSLAEVKQVWRDMCQGATQALLVSKGVLYSASHAHECRQTPGGFADYENRQHFLAQSVRDGRILHWFPDTDEGLGEGIGPRALVMAGSILWAGGEFTMVNGKPQQGLTRFSSGADNNAAPEAGPPQLRVTQSGTGRITLTWRAAWDRDNAELTYRVYRDGRLVASRTGRSAEWDRPDMTYSDSVKPGSHHQYTIAVTDGSNTSPRSRPLEVTAAAGRQVVSPDTPDTPVDDTCDTSEDQPAGGR